MDNVLNDLDNILGRPPTEAAATASAVNDALAEPMKTEKKSKEKPVKNGVGLLMVLIIALLINVFWVGYIEYYIRPSYESRIEEVIAEKDDAIKRIQAVYKVREEDFEKRLTACEEKQAQLEEMYNNAILIIEKYGGDLSFLEDKTKEVKEE